jgi:hypothetical protein
MISTVKAPPNHYAVLGIKPSATDEEIAQAFITKMFSPKPMTQVALIGAAYETLRNPAKRRAYDASLGFRAEPQGVLAKPVVAFSTTARYVGGAPAISFERPAAETAPPVVSAPVEPDVRHEPEPVFELPVAVRADQARDGAFEWRRPAVIAGALVGLVGLVGAWAGSLAGNDVEAEQVTVPLPKAKVPPKVVAAAPEASPQIAEAPRTYVTPRRIERARSRPQPAQDRLAEVGQSLKHSYYVSTGADGTNEIVAADPASAPAAPPAMVAAAGAAAAMPLPNGTIARTLHKIGYSCGQVASTSAVEGQSGVFNVTCTSGQTYRASPVRGRYHFSRSLKN